MPYAWQKKGKTTTEILCKRSKRLNALGFMSRENDAFFHAIESSVTSEVVISAFDGFVGQYAPSDEKTKVPCVVILDNASIHHSKAVKQRANDWMRQGVFLHFLPTYSPELNPIEILWRKIKYEWLSMNSYTSYQTLKESVPGILSGIGNKYTITFA